jgi:hypothetical protein
MEDAIVAMSARAAAARVEEELFEAAVSEAVTELEAALLEDANAAAAVERAAGPDVSREETVAAKSASIIAAGVEEEWLGAAVLEASRELEETRPEGASTVVTVEEVAAIEPASASDDRLAEAESAAHDVRFGCRPDNDPLDGYESKESTVSGEDGAEEDEEWTDVSEDEGEMELKSDDTGRGGS